MKKTLIALAALVAFVGASYAASTNIVVGGTAFGAKDSTKHFVIERTVDFAKYTGVTASNDVIAVLNIPAKTVVECVAYDVVTSNAVDATATFDIGDGNSTARWVSNGTVDVTPGLVMSATAQAVYTVDDTIDVKVDAAITGGVIRVKASCIDFSK